jgi:hypothetical protein
MSLSRIACFVVALFLLSSLFAAGRLAAPPAGTAMVAERIAPATADISPGGRPLLVAAYHGYADSDTIAVKSAADDHGGGIREVVPEKFKAHYQAWKTEFLNTEVGRRQWDIYEHNPNFTLNIVVARDNSQGAGTGQYKWNDAGQLVAATITLGFRINEGYPNPIYYPVMNSLTPNASSYIVNDDTLAAAKIAHEFGHLNRTAKTDATLYQLQTQLMPLYNKILLSNGRNTDDPQLVEIAQKMGGTPVTIWEDREYWGETNAMMYLRDRFTEDLRCPLFSRIRRSVDLYAKSYEPRFLAVAQSVPSHRTCGWQ